MFLCYIEKRFCCDNLIHVIYSMTIALVIKTTSNIITCILYVEVVAQNNNVAYSQAPTIKIM